VLTQIRAAQGSYALSPLFIETHHIKMKPGWAGLLFTLLVLGQSALAENGGTGGTAPMPPKGELARADLVPGCPIGVAHKGALAPAGRRPHHSTRYSSARGAHSQSTVPPLQGDRVQFHPFHRSHWGHPPPWGRAEGGHMWIHKVVLEACPICGKETTFAGWNRIRLIPKRSSIHIDVWIAGRSKPGQFVHGRVDCR
jgi:hypothetical protein